MTNKDEPATSPRKDYCKPQITQVVLRPEEAVLGACKRGSSQSGPGQPRCNFPSACSSQGS